MIDELSPCNFVYNKAYFLIVDRILIVKKKLENRQWVRFSQANSTANASKSNDRSSGKNDVGRGGSDRPDIERKTDLLEVLDYGPPVSGSWK